MKYVLENNNFEVDGKQYLKDVGGYDGTNVDESKDVATVISEIVSTTSEMISVTYNELVSLRDNSELIPGQQYRITDYVTTTTQENTISADHKFDIIVTALDESTLSEEAKAIQNNNEDYFDSCNLSAWKIWYSLDNDTERFEWADSENGKGVIYRMIDEWGNDCPYDFKNIQFKREIYYDGLGIASIEGDGDFYSYCYTFSWEDSQNGIMDASIFGNNGSLLNDEGQINGVYGNIICVYNSYDGDDESPQFTKQYLNDIVFFSTYGYDGGIYYGCYSNTFGNNCYSNNFGNGCFSNTFGNGCSNNTFGDACYSNTFGDECHYNTFGDECYSNTFGGSCYSNTFGNGCHSNTFGISCYGNVFPIYCFHNTFDTSCSRNTVTDNMQKYNIKKGVSEKTINVEFRNSPISIDVWVTSSGELIQEPINEYISFSDIDLIWEKYFGSGSYSGGSTNAILDENINSVGVGDYDENSEYEFDNMFLDYDIDNNIIK